MVADYQDILYNQLSKKIRGVRIELKLTQEEFADRLSISRSSIVNIEKNRQRPTIHLLYEISLLKGSKMDFFFDSMPNEIGNSLLSKKIEKKIHERIDNEESKVKLQEFISKLSSNG